MPRVASPTEAATAASAATDAFCELETESDGQEAADCWETETVNSRSPFDTSCGDVPAWVPT